MDKGYFEPGFNGEGYDPAWQAFSKGKGAFLIAGTWLQADLQKAMGADVHFMLPPGQAADATPVATGGTGLPFAVTSKSPHPDVAAAYINFITDPHAMQVLAKTGNLPVADTAAQQVGAGLQKDVFTAFGTVVKADGLLPYLDYATPTMPDTLGAGLQDLLAKKATPQQFLQRIAEGLRRLLLHQRLGAAVTVEHAAPGTVEEARQTPRRRTGGGPPGEPRRVAYLYLLPAFLVYAAFLLYPLARSVQLSFYRWDGLSLGTWVGLGNYVDVVRDAGLRAAFGHALVLMVFYAVVPLVVGLVLASILNRAKVRGPQLLPHRGVPAPGGGHGRGRRGMAADLRPRRHAQRAAVRGGPGVADPRLARRLHLRPAGGRVHRHVVRDGSGHRAAPGRDGPDLR